MQTSVYMAATDPDLRPFVGHGGKLLPWHGWSDQRIAPQSTPEYYEAMRDLMGTEAVESFAKLYLSPRWRTARVAWGRTRSTCSRR